MSSFDRPKPAADLFEAIAGGDAAEIGRFLRGQEFTLIEAASHEDGGKSPLVGDINDVPVLVAFTSSQHAAQYASKYPDTLDEQGLLPAFVVGGENLLEFLPQGFGVIFNPEAAEAETGAIDPDLVALIKESQV